MPMKAMLILDSLELSKTTGCLSCMQIASYNSHLGLLPTELCRLDTAVYSARCEADVLMSSVILLIADFQSAG
jgi:hypothetical protein